MGLIKNLGQEYVKKIKMECIHSEGLNFACPFPKVVLLRFANEFLVRPYLSIDKRSLMNS